MIPARLAVEYPERCLRLMEVCEPKARADNLLGSFSLLFASAVLVIPYERMGARHPLHQADRDTDLSRALSALDNRERFLSASFWGGDPRQDWRFSRIMNDPNRTAEWVDAAGMHPMHKDAENTIHTRKAGEVIRVLRNALAHGNVVYLNERGFEEHGTKVTYLAFLSRYEETEEQRKVAKTYRLVVTTEEGFLHFIKKWAAWIAGFKEDGELFEAA